MRGVLLVKILINFFAISLASPKCDMTTGIELDEGNMGQSADFSWLGLLKVFLNDGDGVQVAVTGIVLVRANRALANADDVVRIPKRIFQHKTRAMFISDGDLAVNYSLVSYVTHPEYQTKTFNSIAVILLDADDDNPMLPVCFPIVSFDTSHLYLTGFTDENEIVEKMIYRIQYTDRPQCEEFYEKEGLILENRQPISYLCGKGHSSSKRCVWENGMALVSNSSGWFTLIGFSIHGPGCAAPARFISMLHYSAWINDVSRDWDEQHGDYDYISPDFRRTNVLDKEYIPIHRTFTALRGPWPNRSHPPDYKETRNSPEPKQTPETEQPPGTDQPPVTEQPPGTDQPPVTEQPPGTDQPPVTEQPPGTDQPPVTEQPSGTDQPLVTEQPPGTEKPPATDSSPEEQNIWPEGAVYEHDYLKWPFPIYSLDHFTIMPAEVPNDTIWIVPFNTTYENPKDACSNNRKQLLYAEDFDLKTSPGMEGTVTYKLSLYDLFLLECTCVILEVECINRTMALLEFKEVFDYTSLTGPPSPEEVLEVNVVPKRGQKENPLLKPAFIEFLEPATGNQSSYDLYVRYTFQSKAVMKFKMYSKPKISGEAIRPVFTKTKEVKPTFPRKKMPYWGSFRTVDKSVKASTLVVDREVVLDTVSEARRSNGTPGVLAIGCFLISICSTRILLV